GPRKCFREGIIKFVAHRADVINTVSQELDDELIRLGVPESKLLQIPFSVELNMFYPNKDMPRPEATRFICTRRHSSELYDIPTIIDALASLKKTGRKFHCTFTSGGALLEEHKTKAYAAGLRDCVTFTGLLNHNELPKLLRQADIYISASLVDGTSSSLLEAMATGVFPVVSQIRANKSWVEHGRTGLLFECGRADMLAEALKTAIDNAELRRQAFKDNIARVARDCDMNHNMNRLANVFEQLAAGKRPDFSV
ncbi:MAG: glycosyltransferase family 4 protein, partial [Planctomycetota bacterium]